MTNGVKIFIIIILLLIVAIAAFVGYKGITDPAPAVCDPECKWYQECTTQTDGTPVCNLKSYEGFEVKDNTTTNNIGLSFGTGVNPGEFEKTCIQGCNDNPNCKHVVVDTDGKKCWLKPQADNIDYVYITEPDDTRTRVTFLKI